MTIQQPDGDANIERDRLLGPDPTATGDSSSAETFHEASDTSDAFPALDRGVDETQVQRLIINAAQRVYGVAPGEEIDDILARYRLGEPETEHQRILREFSEQQEALSAASSGVEPTADTDDNFETLLGRKTLREKIIPLDSLRLIEHYYNNKPPRKPLIEPFPEVREPLFPQHDQSWDRGDYLADRWTSFPVTPRPSVYEELPIPLFVTEPHRWEPLFPLVDDGEVGKLPTPKELKPLINVSPFFTDPLTGRPPTEFIKDYGTKDGLPNRKELDQLTNRYSIETDPVTGETTIVFNFGRKTVLGKDVTLVDESVTDTTATESPEEL